MNRKEVLIAPSILSADFNCLQEEIKSVESADLLHLDLMDGHFVPNLTFGPPILKNIKTSLRLDWHLMVENPENYFEEIVSVGGEFITIHAETGYHLHRSIQNIKDLGFRAGISLNPATPICSIENIIQELDMVLIMSVNPGFGGQKFIENSLEKIRAVRKLDEKILIQVDGGINSETSKKCIEAGADILVAGSYIFGAKNRLEAIESLRS